MDQSRGHIYCHEIYFCQQNIIENNTEPLSRSFSQKNFPFSKMKPESYR